MLTLKILSEHGIDEALYGVGLSYGLTSNISFEEFQSDEYASLYSHIYEVSKKLAGRGLGHDKFLRAINVNLFINAPLKFWEHLDTYKVGTVAQSESAMHTLLKNPITIDDFAIAKPAPVDFQKYVDFLEKLRQAKDFDTLADIMPQNYLKARTVNLNYAVLANILKQRKGHKYKCWKMFIEQIEKQILIKEYLK